MAAAAIQPEDGLVRSIKCPRCESREAADALTCTNCGFPFVCDITEVKPNQGRGRHVAWRTLLGIAAVLFWLVNSVFLHSGYANYYGDSTSAIAGLEPDMESGIEITGPDNFVHRTQLVLALLKERSQEYYWRVTDNVVSIEYLAPSYLESPEGKKISLEGIGAMAEPATGRVMVLYATAFPRGVDSLTDFSVFSYAGVLVHELRHIELHKSGLAPGGWEEEALCERAAYNCLESMGAPGAALMRYDMYFHDPQASRYQGWYDWYNQW